MKPLIDNTSENNADVMRSKYAEKQAKKRAKHPTLASTSPNSINNSKIEDTIKNTPAKHSALNALKYRVSHRVETASKTEKQIALCAETGIVIALDIPRISGFAFSYTSPFSLTDNCRLIAQKGFAYLNNLDTQILAGILISLADSYNLFTFAPSASGAEKNAILRTAGKLQIINAIRFIEEKVYSNNYHKLPRLSLLIDSHLVQGDIEARLLSYLKLCVETLTMPAQQDEVYDENKAPTKTITPDYASKAAKRAKAASILANKKQREFNKALETASKNAKSLFKAGMIKIKLRDVLVQTLTKEMFALIPLALKQKAIERLSELPLSETAKQIITVLRTDVNASDVELDDFAPVPTVESTKASSFPVLPKTIASLQDYWDPYDGSINSDADFFATLPADAIISNEGLEQSDQIIPSESQSAPSNVDQAKQEQVEQEGVALLTIHSTNGSFTVPTALWHSLNAIQKIAYRKKQLG